MVRMLQGRGARRRLPAVLLAVAAVVGVAVSMSAGSASAASAKPIMIAGVAPFSGGFASSTLSDQHSWAWVIANINAKGGINSHKVDMVVKDDMGEPNLALDDVRAYLAQGIHVFWLQDTADVLAVKGLMSGDNIIVFTQNPVAEQNDPKQLPYDFNFIPDDQVGVLATIKDAEKKHYTKWAVVSDTTGEFQDYVTFLKQYEAGAHASIVYSSTYDPAAATDFSPTISQIKSSGADAIFFYGVGTPVNGFLTAMASAGLNVPIYGGYGDVVADFSQYTTAFLKLTHFPSFTPNMLAANGQPLIAAYGKLANIFFAKYGRTPDVGGSVAVDEADICMWALKQTKGNPDPKLMRTALEKTAAMGGIAPTSPQVTYKFSPTNHGGFPPSQVEIVSAIFNSNWPGFFSKSTT